MRAVRAMGAVGVGIAIAAGTLAAPAGAAQVYYVPSTDQLTVVGHGYGHGNGLSQHGAEGAARMGKGYREILRTYYPGTKLGTMRGRVRVLLTADTTADVKVSPARGLSVRDLADGSTWQLPVRPGVGRWRLLPDRRVQFHNGSRWRQWDVPGRTRLRGEGEFFADGPITLWVPSGGSEVGKRYRGNLRSAAPSRGSTDRDTVNVLAMDQYIRGVVPAEMPASWSLEALKSQAVAARTYATRDRVANRTRYYQTCDTTSCQVYGGVGSEYSSTNKAVHQTARQILRYRGEPAFTQFSSSSGGYTGDGGFPYLRAQPDPWDDWAGNSVHTWRTTVSATTLERRYALGRLLAVRVTQRNGHGHWGGRVDRIRLDGSRRDVYISGDDFRWAYGLRSRWFRIESTAIMQRWHSIGGRDSRVGAPVTAEREVHGSGAMQRFRRGRIFWHPRIGARETYGPILRAYLSIGGTSSPLGYPQTGVRDAGDGHVVVYQRGRIYRNPGHGAHTLRRGWLTAYAQTRFARGGLGLPRSDVFAIRGGQRMRFDGGHITRTFGAGFRVHIR